MDPSEYYEYEDRAYINPTLSRDEQLGFVDTFRNVVGNNTAQINSQTKRLGTDISSNLGGLTGSNGYFAQRYQTAPLEAHINTLKATAQAKALNDLMTNYQSQLTNKYNQAYRSAKKRAAAAAAAAAAGNNGGYGDGGYGGEEPWEYDASRDLTVPAGAEKGTWYGTADGYKYNKDANGNIIWTNDPTYKKTGTYYTNNEAANTILQGKRHNASAPFRGIQSATSMIPGVNVITSIPSALIELGLFDSYL